MNQSKELKLEERPNGREELKRKEGSIYNEKDRVATNRRKS